MEQACTEMHWHSPTSPVKIEMMTANRLHYRMPEWHEWKTVIGNVLCTCPNLPPECNVDSIIARLKEEIGKSMKCYSKAIVLHLYLRLNRSN